MIESCFFLRPCQLLLHNMIHRTQHVEKSWSTKTKALSYANATINVGFDYLQFMKFFMTYVNATINVGFANLEFMKFFQAKTMLW